MKYNSTADIVRKYLKFHKMSQKTLAKRMGIPFRVLSSRFCDASDLKYKEFEKMFECIGYEIQPVPTPYFRVCPALFNYMLYGDGSRMNVPSGIWTYDTTQTKAYKALIRINGEAVTYESDYKDEVISWLKSYKSTE